MLHCILCGTGNDAKAQYCQGIGCGADLLGQREGDPSRAVQVDADPDEVAARAGDLVESTVTIRNAGSTPDKYVLELRRDIGDRVTVERHGEPSEVPPDGTCTWTVRYAVPQDWHAAGHLVGVGGLFGVPGAEAAGFVQDSGDAGDDTIEVPLRIVSAHDRLVAAGAVLTIVPLAETEFDVRYAGASSHAKRQSRRNVYAAGGAVAAVGIVAALIVGMAAAGSGGGGKDDPTRKAVTTTTSLPGNVATDDGAAQAEFPTGIPTVQPSEPTSAAPKTGKGSTRTATKTSNPPQTDTPPTAPAPGGPPPATSAPVTSGPAPSTGGSTTGPTGSTGPKPPTTSEPTTTLTPPLPSITTRPSHTKQ
ncbi:MAG: hypothetical protein HOV68_01505 [Streptomycetaceae bacterium]|nr:hypothetical protein [Streptomycetaceae bacterium]